MQNQLDSQTYPEYYLFRGRLTRLQKVVTTTGLTVLKLRASSVGVAVDEPLCINFGMLAHYLLKYPLKCASAGPAGAHFSGYLNKQ